MNASMTRFEQKRCRHFNGIQNKRCLAGITYDEVVSKISLFPCFADEGAKNCSKYIAPTPGTGREFVQNAERLRLSYDHNIQRQKERPRAL